MRWSRPHCAPVLPAPTCRQIVRPRLALEHLEDRWLPQGTVINAVATGPGTPALVSIFQASNGVPIFTFSPYGTGFQGGVRVAVGDVNGDGESDVVTAPGPGGGPNVKVFDGAA